MEDSEADYRKLISREEIEYTRVPITAQKDTYKANDDIDLKWSKQNRFLDLQTLMIVVQYNRAADANLNAPTCAQDLVSCTSIRTGANEILPNYRQQGRHLMTNFLRTGLKSKAQMRQSGAYQVGEHDYTATAAQSKNARSVLEFQNKVLKQTGNAGDPGVYTYLEIPLVDVCVELYYMDIWDLRINDLEITLRCTEDRLVQFRAIGDTANAGAANVKTPAITYSLSQLLVYQRMYIPKSGIPAAHTYRREMTTMVQYPDTLTGANHDVRVSLQHKWISGLMIFITPNAQTGTGAGGLVKYDPPNDTNLYSPTSQSLAIQHNDIYVEIGGRRYKQIAMPFSGKAQASYLDNKMAIEQMFPGMELSCDFNEFIQNKYFHCIPINPQSNLDEAFSGQAVANIHFDFAQQFHTGAANVLNSNAEFAKYSVNLFFVVKQELINDKVER